MDQIAEAVRLQADQFGRARSVAVQPQLGDTVVAPLFGRIDQVDGVAPGARRAFDRSRHVRYMGLQPVAVQLGPRNAGAALDKKGELGRGAAGRAVDVEVFGHRQPVALGDIGVVAETVVHDLGRGVAAYGRVVVLAVAEPQFGHPVQPRL